MKNNLIDFGDEEDLIKPKDEKDLIDFDTIIPPKNQQHKNYLWMKNYFQREKSIKF